VEIVKILFECSSITPSESCGVEMFLYSLLSGFQQLEYGDELFVNIPPGTRDKYEDVVDGSVVNLVEDQWQKHLLRIDGDCFSPGKVFFKILRKLGFARLLDPLFHIPRSSWAKQCEIDVDVVLYPVHKGIKIRHNKKPVVLVMHDLRDLERNTDGLLPFYYDQINSCRAIITSWPHPFQLLKTYFPELVHKFHMIHFSPEPMPDAKDLKNDSLNRLLLYPSSNGIDKNHENLIQALGILKKQGQERIRIICPGTQTNGRTALLHELAVHNGVQDWISFIGFVPRDHVRWLYQICSGVVTTTKYEAFSGAVFEGFCYGKPIACSNIPPIKMLIDQMQVKVKYFNPDDPGDIASSILEILDNPTPYSFGSLSARQYISSITQENTARQYRKVFLEVMK